MTTNQIMAAEQAERETRETFNRRLLKSQFVNGIQNADAHQVIIDEEMEEDTAKPYRRRSVMDDSQDDNPQAAAGAAWKPYSSSSGVKRLDQATVKRKVQAESDLTPRARIQVMFTEQRIKSVPLS